MKGQTRRLVVGLCGIAALALEAPAALVAYSPTGVTLDAGSQFFPVGNLIGGSGLSGAVDVYNLDAITHADASASTAWVTTNPNGGGDYYLAGSPGPNPVMTFDLGASRNLTDIVLWGYHFGGTPNNNEARAFDLEFSADGISYGTPVGLDHGRSAQTGQAVPLGGTYSARYVRMTLTDNYFGIAGATGGDRVGLGEVMFLAVDDPAEVIGAGTLYKYTTTSPYATPGFSGGTYYFDDTHGTFENYNSGDLTDGAAFPSTSSPTSPAQSTLVGYDPAADQGQVVFDLGAAHYVDTVRIGTHTWSAFANGVPDDVQVAFSDNGVTFTVPSTVALPTPTFDGHHDLFIDAGGVQAQYVQLTFDGGALPGTANKYLFDEVTIYGTAIPEPSTALLLLVGMAVPFLRRRA